MILRSSALLVTVSAATAFVPLAAFAQKSTFDILLEDKKVGKDVFSIEKDKRGYKLSSRLTFRMEGADGDFSGEYKLDDKYAYQSLDIRNNNTLSSNSYIANKTQTQLDIGTVQGPLHDSNAITITPNLMVLPPFDPAAAQAVLLLAVTYPSKGDLYDVYLPAIGGGGRGGGGGRRGGGAPATADDAGPAGVEAAGIPHDAKWFKGKPSGGTLDGQPILLNTYLLAFGRARYYMYANEKNDLMQVNVPGMKASYVRVNFKLNATAPSAATPPPAPKP